MTGLVVVVKAEFLVCLAEGWVPTCAEHLPVLVRRAFRFHVMPMVRPCRNPDECKVAVPHPYPCCVPINGAGCPRPLSGPCADNTCDHD